MKKHELIALFKENIAAIPFQTVESNWDVLFDCNYQENNKQHSFLKTTRLSEIKYSNTEDHAFFTITKAGTENYIQVSNRFPSNGELRGEVLRHVLNKKSKKEPDSFIYNAIESEVKSIHSTFITMMKGPAIHIYSMSQVHFDLFVSIVLAKINEKIQNGELDARIDPGLIGENKDLQDEIWKGIDIEKIYDKTKSLSEHFQQIQQKSEELSRRGYSNASNVASNLYDNLIAKIGQLAQDEICIPQFAEECSALIDDAKKSELQEHRGFFGQLWYQIQRALSCITLGYVKMTPTDSMKKMMQMRNVVQFFLSGEDVKSGEAAEDSPKIKRD